MSIAQLNPYLNFDGTSEQAIKLYERALGAKVEFLQRFGEMSPSPQQMSDAQKQRVLHARIKVGAADLLISDTPPGQPPAAGNNVMLCLQCTDAEALKTQFAALSEGGKVVLAPRSV